MKPSDLPEPFRSRVLDTLPPSQHDWEIDAEGIFEALLNDHGIYGYGTAIAKDFRFAFGADK